MFPNPEKVVGSIAIVTTFLGVLLGISTKQYNASDKAFDGVINVTDTNNGLKAVFDIPVEPHELVQKNSVTLRINRQIALPDQVA